MKTVLTATVAIALALGGCTVAKPANPLLGAEWVIEDIAGAGVIDNSHAMLVFLPDGRLTGNATCNRIIGSYETTAQTLSIKPVGTTMMACPEALMNQERKLLDLLPTITSYQIDATDALILAMADGKTIVARRQHRQ